MPHTSHRSRPRRHPTKQQQTTDEDGWTHVTRAPTARDAAKALARSSLTPAQPYTADASLTPTRLAADYASVLVRWRESEARGHALRFLAGTGVKIERAICVGLGAVGRSEGRWRTLWQLAMFCDLCDEVAGSPPITMAVREPALVDGDDAFLSSLGITVLSSDDEALDCVASGTFAFLPFLEKVAERPYLARAAECELYISTRASEAVDHFRMYANGQEGVDGALRGAKRLGITHDEARIGQVDGDGQALMGLWIYRRRNGEEEIAGS